MSFISTLFSSTYPSYLFYLITFKQKHESDIVERISCGQKGFLDVHLWSQYCELNW